MQLTAWLQGIDVSKSGQGESMIRIRKWRDITLFTEVNVWLQLEVRSVAAVFCFKSRKKFFL